MRVSSSFIFSIVLGLLFSLPSVAHAQQQLTEDMLIEIMRSTHPLVKSAEIEVEIGQMAFKRAKGNFDPQLFADTYNKYFEGQNYYRYNDAELFVPTRLAGISFSAGYEQNKGNYLNPEKTTPDMGLWHAGINIPLAQGLWTDQARTQLAQAREGIVLSEAVRAQLINNLLLQATLLYWDWVEAYNKFNLFTEGAEMLKVRFEAVKEAFYNGERPAVDTLEAFIQYQNFEIAASQASISNINRFQSLLNFMWVDIESTAMGDWRAPQLTHFDQALDMSLPQGWEVHPEIMQWQQRIKQIKLEERWKKERLKPRVDLKYNFLQSKPNQLLSEANFFNNNYQWGLRFSFPILLRRERFDLKIIQLQTEQMELNRAQNLAVLKNENEAQIQMYERLLAQFAQLNSNVINNERLLTVEKRKFELGESSVFLINAREVNVMDAKVRRLETLSRIKKTEKTYLWNLGILYQQ